MAVDTLARLFWDRVEQSGARPAQQFKQGGVWKTITWRETGEIVRELALGLIALGRGKGDTVALLSASRAEWVQADFAIFSAGCVSVPVYPTYPPDLIAYVVNDSGARTIIVEDPAQLAKVLEAQAQIPQLEHIVVMSGYDAPQPPKKVMTWATLRRLGRESEAAHKSTLADRVASTRPEDVATIVYTSGTTGPPKGALHAHRTLLGHLPGVEFYHEFCPQPGDRFWTPADWAWVGGLLDVLLPAWHYGLPVVAHRPKRFDAERCLEMLARHRVRNTFLVPTMLKMMRAWGDPRARFDVRLRTLFTGGEAAGEEVIRWARECLGVTPNEGYGQTEVNLVLGNCSAIMEVKPGSMGRPIPGHAVDVLDDAGRPVPAGEIGEVAVRRPDPVMFLGYWKNEAATREKFIGDWALTGDLARRDADGYFWFVGRKDDLISSGGYRIGPGEIEECLGRHPAVALAAAIGAPDPLRGEVVKAFVQLRPGTAPSPELARELKDFVRTRLSAHEYPRDIEFIEALPATTTGKVKRGDLRALERARRAPAH